MYRCFGYVFHDTNGQNHERNLYGHPLAGLLWERQFEEPLLELGWEKVPNWKCMFVHRKQGLFLSVHVDDIKKARKEQNMAPIWKIWWKKKWILTNPLHLLTCVLGMYSARRQTEWDNYWTTQEDVWISHFCWSNGKLPGWEDVTRKLKRGPTIWSDMLKNASSDTVNWQTRKWSSITKFQILAWIIVNSSRKNSSEVCSQIVLNCLYLARIGQPDIQWSVNKLARSVTKWTQACNRQLARLISYIRSHKRFPTILSCGKHGTAL